MSETKKSGAEKAVDRAEDKARTKLIAAIDAWERVRRAQHSLAGDACHDLDAVSEARSHLIRLAVAP